MQAAFNNFELVSTRFEKVKQILQSHKTVNSNQIASIGYCFGGSVSLRMAQRGSELDGVVAFHSALTLEPDASKKNKSFYISCKWFTRFFFKTGSCGRLYKTNA